MFNFLNPLTPEDFNQKTEFLIEGFIPKHLITMVYADGGTGKSWLATALAKYAAQQNMTVVYLDYDNPINVLKERGIEQKLIQSCSNLHYAHRSKTDLQPLAMLEELENMAIADCYKNTLFVLDSLRDFGDINNDNVAMRIGDKLKNIREAGATIIILHHSNKDGRNYQGSNNIRNSIDNMYQLTKIDSQAGEIRWVLTVKKERAAIMDTALSVKVDDLSMLPIDIQSARITNEDKILINEVKTLLTKQPGINKTDLLTELGYKKTNRPIRDKLDQFEELYWRTEKGAKNTTLYYLNK